MRLYQLPGNGTISADIAHEFRVRALRDANGNTTAVGYDTSGRVSWMRDSRSRTITLTYTAGGKVDYVEDSTGRRVSYTYTAAGELEAVTAVDGRVETYTYDGSHRITGIRKPGRTRSVINVYDALGRVSDQTDERLGVTHFVYGTPATVPGPGSTATTTVPVSMFTNTVTGPLGRRMAYTYIGNRLVTQTVDTSAGRATTTYEYGTDGMTSAVTDPLGRTVRYVYNAAGDRTEVTDALGNATRSTFDEDGNVTSVTNPEGETSTLTFDDRDNPIGVGDATGASTSTTFNADGTVDTVTTPLGVYGQDPTGARTVTYDYDAFGYPTSTTTGLGARTEATYDGLGRVLTSVGARGTVPGAVKADYTTTWTYDAAGRVLTVRRPGETKASVIVYDGAGRPERATDTLDRVTTREYDPATGDLTASVDVKGRRTTYTYDARGRLATVTDPLGRVTSTTYDGADQVRTTTDALGRVTTYTYDVAGQLVKTILPIGRLVLRTYDGAGRLVTVTAAGATTTYTYDDAGRMVTSTSTVGATGATVTRYDRAGRVVAVRRPDGTTVTSTYDRVGQLTEYADAAGRLTHYAYDVDGNRTAVTDTGGRTTGTAWVGGYAMTVTTADAKTIGYSYDAAGRVVGVDYSDATPDVAYAYDAAGRRTGMVDGAGATTWVYDSDDTVTSVTGPQGDLAYTYDAAGRRTGLTYPGTTGTGGPRAVTYTYDDVDRLTGVGDWTGGGYAYSWNSDDQPATLTYPNGVVTTNTYDPATTQLSRVSTAKGGVTLLDLAYTYNTAQLVTGETRTGKTTTGATLSGTRAYTYDTLARLTGATLTDTSTTPATSSTRAYTFDTADQLATLGDGTAVAHDAAGQVTTLTPTTGPASTYTYDGRGNRTVTVTSGGPTVTTGYDLADRLTTWTSTATAGIPAAGYTFTYAGDGLRATATPTTGTGAQDAYLWDRLLDLPTLVQDGGHQYIYGLGTTPLAQIDQTTGTITYLHADALGSTRATTDTTGAVTTAIDYDPYGQTLTPTTGVTGITRFLYTGQYLDPTGLYYLRARYYNPTDATFLTRDPIEDTTHDAYGYASGNPVGSSDPSGLCSLSNWLKSKFSTALIDPCQSEDMNPASSMGRALGSILAMQSDEMMDAALAGTANGFGLPTNGYQPDGELECLLYDTGSFFSFSLGLSSGWAGEEEAAVGGGRAVGWGVRALRTRGGDAEATAAERALANLPRTARESPKPRGWNPATWEWREGSRANVPRSWWDPEGGEWRFHPEDPWHDPHWDVNPWEEWNTPWQHLYPEG